MVVSWWLPVHVFSTDQESAQEATDLKSQVDEAGPEDSKAEQPEKQAFPLVSVSKLQQHMELPVMVDQKMIRDILGVEYIVEMYESL